VGECMSTTNAADQQEILSIMPVNGFVDRYLVPIACLLRPELRHLNEQKRLMGVGEVLGFLFALPPAVLGVIWLIALTDISVISQNAMLLAFLALAKLVFRKVGFFMITEIRPGRYASLDESLESMITWTALLLIGVESIWIAVLLVLVDFLLRWFSVLSIGDKWTAARNFTLSQASSTTALLAAFLVYRQLGGQVPIAGLAPSDLGPAFLAIAAFFIFQFAIWSFYFAYGIWIQKKLTDTGIVRPIATFMLMALALPSIGQPFGVLLAGLYVEQGLLIFSLFLAGLLMAAYLTRRLSWTAENARQQSRQLEKLELLGRAILTAPPDASTLPEILQDHVPPMFPSGRITIWLDGEQVLMVHPTDWQLELDPVETWLSQEPEIQAFPTDIRLPWQELNIQHNPIIVAPITAVDGKYPIGGVYLELFNLGQPWGMAALRNLFPAVQTLSAQVASALHQAEMYSQALAYQRISQELILAGRIQASFFPEQMPSISGWQLAVTLLPARETSGDYFDLIQLSDGKLGVLIADVTDKGVGAALYMALSRTLIRTYALEFYDDAQPEVILFAANNRLLQDARADLFVTTFYGILDPESGELVYSNAGHNPPFLIKKNNSSTVIQLRHTGMPIGVEEDTVWARERVVIEPGDVLVLYTDGIPDSQNMEGEFLGEEPFIESVLSASGGAGEIQECILETVQEFTRGAPQYDDITMIVLVRDAE
jgi:serine phosphatase RsbU (regulator of sigma subunit)